MTQDRDQWLGVCQHDNKTSGSKMRGKLASGELRLMTQLASHTEKRGGKTLNSMTTTAF